MRHYTLHVTLLVLIGCGRAPGSSTLDGVNALCYVDGCTLEFLMSVDDLKDRPVREERLEPDGFGFLSPEMTEEGGSTLLDIRSIQTAGLDVETTEAEVLKLGLLIDNSGSMSSADSGGQRFEASAQLIEGILDAEAGAQIALYSFPRDHYRGDLVNTDVWQDYTSDREALLSALEELESVGLGGGTPLYESMGEVAEALDASLSPEESVRPALIVLTDGEDSYNEAVDAQLTQLGTMLNVVALGSLDLPELRDMAASSGGLFTSAWDADQLSDIFARFTRSLYSNVSLQMTLALSEDSPGIEELTWYRLTGDLVYTEPDSTTEVFSVPVNELIYVDTVDAE